MYGIDTPESRTRDLEEKKYGLAAKGFLEKWTNAGHLVLRTFKDGKGKYGRILGQIWYEDTHNINQLLIDNHHAVAYHGQSKEEIAEQHIKNREFVKTSCYNGIEKNLTNVFGINKIQFVDTNRRTDRTWEQYPSPPP